MKYRLMEKVYSSLYNAESFSKDVYSFAKDSAIILFDKIKGIFDKREMQSDEISLFEAELTSELIPMSDTSELLRNKNIEEIIND